MSQSYSNRKNALIGSLYEPNQHDFNSMGCHFNDGMSSSIHHFSPESPEITNLEKRTLLKWMSRSISNLKLGLLAQSIKSFEPFKLMEQVAELSWIHRSHPRRKSPSNVQYKTRTGLKSAWKSIWRPHIFWLGGNVIRLTSFKLSWAGRGHAPSAARHLGPACGPPINFLIADSTDPNIDKYEKWTLLKMTLALIGDLNLVELCYDSDGFFSLSL